MAGSQQVYLGLGSGLQLLQLFGCGFDGRRRPQQLRLGDDGGVLGVHALRAWTRNIAELNAGQQSRGPLGTGGICKRLEVVK